MTPVAIEASMYRKAALTELGGWDQVETTPVYMLHWRIKAAWGKASVRSVSKGIPLLLSEFAEHVQAPTHLEFPAGARRDAFRRLMRQVDVRARSDKGVSDGETNIPFVMAPLERSIQLPQLLDVIVVGDFTKNALGMFEIKSHLHRLLSSGAEVGVFNWPDYGSVQNHLLDDDIADLIDYRVLHHISSGVRTKAKHMILSNPYVLSHRFDEFLVQPTERVTVFAGPPLTMAEINYGYRRSLPSRASIEDKFGVPCHWQSL